MKNYDVYYISRRKMANSEVISATNLAEAVSYVFQSEGYSFELNKGLIDIEKKFRYFTFRNKGYIAKRVKKSKALIEVKNADTIKKILGKKNIENYFIEIIVPELINVNDAYYCVSEYKGISLENYYYVDCYNTIFPVSILKSCLETFIEAGIYYYDFLPRNTILVKNKIYLLDFENVLFKNEVVFDIRWNTNFLLNWSNIFNMDLLLGTTNHLVDKKISENNYNLASFESAFKKIIGIHGDNIKVRSLILNTVIFAERKYDIKCSGLVPMDICHFISDIFGTDIDVFSDILFYLIRKKNEHVFTYFTSSLTDSISSKCEETIKKEFAHIFYIMKSYIYIEYNKIHELRKTRDIIDYNIVDIFKKEVLK